jgi:hypothetical protein
MLSKAAISFWLRSLSSLKSRILLYTIITLDYHSLCNYCIISFMQKLHILICINTVEQRKSAPFQVRFFTINKFNYPEPQEQLLQQQRRFSECQQDQ